LPWRARRDASAPRRSMQSAGTIPPDDRARHVAPRAAARRPTLMLPDWPDGAS